MTGDTRVSGPRLRHEAYLYDDHDEMLGRVRQFVDDGVESGEPVMICLDEVKLDALSAKARRDRVRVADIRVAARNPARLLPAIREFVDHYAGDAPALRIVVEPMWADRPPAEVSECHRHDHLLNMALAATPLWLQCPYDTTNLEPAVIDRVRRSHPVVLEGGRRAASPMYVESATAIDEPLPPPPLDASLLDFGQGSLPAVRHTVEAWAAGAGLDHERAAALVLAVNEIATNSLLHGGGSGRLRTWFDAGPVCEVSDGGWIIDPLVGGSRQPSGSTSGRGVWLVHQLCDLVQLRSGPDGTVVRMHMRAS